MSSTQTAQKEIRLSRILDAPRAVVFNAWTDPKQVARWWGPAGWSNPVCEVDARPGGKIHIVMRGPEPWGDSPMHGQFREVVPPERLVFVSSAIPDTNGDPQLETLNTITFAERDGKTVIDAHIVVMRSTPEAAPALAGMEEGWKQQLERLAAALR